MTKTVRIPDKVTPSPDVALRLRWKFFIRLADVRCRRQTGVGLADLYNEMKRDEHRKRRKPKARAGESLRKAVDSPA